MATLNYTSQLRLYTPDPKSPGWIPFCSVRIYWYFLLFAACGPIGASLVAFVVFEFLFPASFLPRVCKEIVHIKPAFHMSPPYIVALASDCAPSNYCYATISRTSNKPFPACQESKHFNITRIQGAICMRTCLQHTRTLTQRRATRLQPPQFHARPKSDPSETRASPKKETQET